MNRPALAPALNAAILQLAPAFDARANAPATLGELMQARNNLALPVFDGASDGTIWADAKVNHAFRAWHDWHHALGQGEAHPFAFSLAGEAETCEAQIKELLAMYPSAPALWATILRCEVNAQGEYAARTGAFPLDQYQFTLDTIGGFRP